MFGHCLRLVIGVLGFSACVGAADFGANKYDVYLGDINPIEDEIPDIYLHGKEQFILIHGDIATPIVIPPGHSYQILSDYTITPGVMGFSGSYENDLHPVEVVDPPYDQDERNDRSMILLQENQDYFWGDFDGDGNTDFLLAIEGAGTEGSFEPGLDAALGNAKAGRFVLMRGDGTSQNTPEATQANISGVFADELYFFSNDFEVRDYDGDGRDELVHNGGGFSADVTLSFSSNTTDLTYEMEFHEAPLTIKTSNINGASTGSFRVSESGAAVYNVPISVPVGTAGVAPELSLNYSSQNGNGLLGLGWQLSGVSAISRCRKTLIQDGFASPLSWNEATFCLGGQRLIRQSSFSEGVIYKTASTGVVKITAYGSENNPDYFELISKDGSLTTFGGSVDSRQNGLGDSSYSWSINRFEDSVSNEIVFDYLQNNGSDFRISTISYAFAGGVSPYSQIEFLYENRPDRLGGYIAGHPSFTTLRLQSIAVKNKESTGPNGDALAEVRRYSLHYLRSFLPDVNDKSFVSAVQECVNNDCLPPTYFDWARENEFEIGETVVTDKITVGKNKLNQTVPMDIDGDGYLDMVWAEAGEYMGDHFYKIMYMMFDPIAQEFTDRKDFIGATGSCVGGEVKQRTYRILLCESPYNKYKQAHLQSVDYNADGRQDLAVYRNDKDSWYIYLSTLTSSGEWQLSGTATAIINPGSDNSIFMDADSDGLQDIVSTSRIFYLRRKPGVDLSSADAYHYVEEVDENGDVVTPDWIWEVDRFEFSNADYIVSYRGLAFVAAGDFNGDGVADAIVADRKIPDGEGEFYHADMMAFERYFIALREGNTFRVTRAIGPSVAFDDFNGENPYVPGNRNGAVRPFSIGDVNGDGYSDILNKAYKSEDNYSYNFYLNTGDGFADPVLLENLDVDAGAPVNEIDYVKKYTSLQDIDADGYLDIVMTRTNTGSVKYKSWNNSTSSFEDRQLGGVPDTLKGRGGRSMFYDVTGDGRLDYVYFSADRFGFGANTGTGPLNVVTHIRNGLGAVTDINYEPLHSSDHYRGLQYAATSDSSGDVDVGLFYRLMNDPFDDIQDEESFLQNYRAPVLEYLSPVQVVTSISGSAPAGDVYDESNPTAVPNAIDASAKSQLEYYYYQSRIQAGGQGFLGFKALMTEEPQSEVRTTTFYRQDWPFVGMPYRTEQRSGDGDLMGLSHTTLGLMAWDSSWEDTLLASDTGASALPLLRPYLKEILEESYKFKTSDSDPIQISPVSVPNTPVYCKLGGICPAPTNKGTVLLKSSVVKNDYDGFSNLEKVTTTTTAGSLSVNQVVDSTFPEDLTISLHDEIFSYAQLGRVTAAVSSNVRNSLPSVSRKSSFTYFETGAHAGLLASEVVEPDTPDSRMETTYSYDTYGNKTRADTVARNHVYDFDGSVISTEDQTRSQSFIMDAEAHRYVNSTVNILDGLSHTEEIVTARNEFGSPAKIESLKSDIEITVRYDVLGREVYRGDNADSVNYDGVGSWTTTEYLKCSGSMRCPNGTSYVVRKAAADGSLSLSFYDVLARVTRDAVQTFDGRLSYTDTQYDSKGRVQRKSLPYFAGSPVYWTHYRVDVLGRTVEVISPNGAHQYQSYNGFSTTFTNAVGVSRTENKNGLGELESVSEALGATTEYDYDNYGNLAFMRSIPAAGDTDQSVLVTEVRYDHEGRKTYMNDPDKGVWEYRYNGFGDLVWQKDGKGQVVTQRYDGLARMTERTDYLNNGGVEGQATWFYDGETDTARVVDNAWMQVSAVVMRRAEGSLCDASAAIQCVYPSYDEFGRNTSSEVHNSVKDGGSNRLETFITETVYDDIGRVASQTDALNMVVTSNRSTDSRYLDDSISSGIENDYNDYGYLKRVIDLQTRKPIFNLLSTNASGQALQVLRGNNVTSENTYDPLTGQLIKQVGNISDIFRVQHIDYTWSDIGNLSSRSNDSKSNLGTGPNRGLQESFCYDELNRLVKTNANTLSISSCESLSPANQDMRYDSRGNILYKHDVGSYVYDRSIAGPHAVTSTTAGDSYQYDDNGNMTASFGTNRRQMTYSSFDKVTSIIKGAASAPDHTTSFRYGADRARYWREDIDKNGVVTTTEYRGNVERITKSNEPGKVEWKRYLGKTSLITMVTDNNNILLDGVDNYKESYIYNDHLGSLDVITDGAGTVVQSMSFDPWGSRRNADTWQPLDISDLSVLASLKSITTRGYTGHEMLDEVGVIHMNGRIYDPRLARFMQADPIIQAATSTQSLNRYAYVWNNPLNSTDPTGYINDYAWQKALPIIVQAVITIVAIASCGGNVACGAIAGAFMGGMWAAVNGANDRGILKAAITGAISGSMGAYAEGAEWAWYYEMAAMGTAGGVTSVLGGGKFGHGFVAAVVTPQGGKFGVIGAAVVGGAISKMTGGKFESGAASGAFNYVAGSLAHGNVKDSDGFTGEERGNLRRGLTADGRVLLASVDEGVNNEAMAAALKSAQKARACGGRPCSNRSSPSRSDLNNLDGVTEALVIASEKAGTGWEREYRDVWHNMGVEPGTNRKYTNSDGREAVFTTNANGLSVHVTDHNGPTYNYGRNDFTHTLLDVIPYFFEGAGPNDTSNFWDRITVCRIGCSLD
ncbi:MAG: FG-GAP-like repeat-containing protein [Agarilytica sp.]